MGDNHPNTNTGRAEFFGKHAADAARAGHGEIAAGCGTTRSKMGAYLPPQR